MSKLYGIVDTARDKRLYPLIKQSPHYTCLFLGDIPEPLDAAAPYLVEMTDDTPLKNIWRNEGWGKAWGILVRSSLDMKGLRRHLRKFLLAQMPDGEAVFFRFYDPRVWRIYWPTCTHEEQVKWMRGVEEFVVED
jgi:Domain of unknown function (DUF4123)